MFVKWHRIKIKGALPGVMTRRGREPWPIRSWTPEVKKKEDSSNSKRVFSSVLLECCLNARVAGLNEIWNIPGNDLWDYRNVCVHFFKCKCLLVAWSSREPATVRLESVLSEDARWWCSRAVNSFATIPVKFYSIHLLWLWPGLWRWSRAGFYFQSFDFVDMPSADPLTTLSIKWI